MNKTSLKNIPVIDSSKCIRCDKCMIACPTGAIKNATNNTCAKCIKYCISMKVPCNPAHYVFSYKKCDACGLCVIACDVNAMYWVDKTKLVFKRVN